MEHEEICKKFGELVVKSEERIDRTNEMISKCVNIISQVTSEYTKQIEKLQASRDLLLEQNSQLLKLVQKYEDRIEVANQKYDKLLDKILSISNRSENNINVK